MTYAQRKLADYLEPDKNLPKPSNATKSLLDELDVTVGFTIDHLGQILDNLQFNDVSLTQQTQLLGWIFWMPHNPPEDNDKLIREISIDKVQLVIDNTGSTVARTPLNFPGTENTVTLSPKIFYQPKSLNSPLLSPTYQEAFDQTLPRVLPDDDIPVSEFEEYENWTDFAFLAVSDLKSMKTLTSEVTSIYSDVFFSGARINYATSHNPLMRQEQLNLLNKHTGQVLAPLSHLPFTLKAEYYVASDDDARDWLRSPDEVESRLPPPIPEPENDEAPDPESSTTNREILNTTNNRGAEADEAPIVAVNAYIPGTILLSPCPPVWFYPAQIGAELMAIYPDLTNEDIAGLVNVVYQSLINPEPGQDTSSINVDNLTLDKAFPPPVVVKPVPKTFWKRLLDFWNAFVALFLPSNNH